MHDQPDPAAVFACAKSLHDACLERLEVDLTEAYRGMDVFMREVMRVGELFETWACRHVAFEELEHVWPYLLDENFGVLCLEVMDTDGLPEFDADDCLRIALKLRLPMWADGSLPLPLTVEAKNPLPEAGFRCLRIQTVRRKRDGEGGVNAFTEDDDPFDAQYGAPFFGIYGVTESGTPDFIADKETYQEAREGLEKLLPGIGFPEKAIAFSRKLKQGGGPSDRIQLL